MSYQARYSGEITITPPLTWAEILHPARIPHRLQDLRIRLHEEVTDTETGRLTVATGEAVTAAIDQGSGYVMVGELQSLVDVYGENHQFTGHIQATGDEGDQWRLLVRDGEAIQVYPRVVWPDEEGS